MPSGGGSGGRSLLRLLPMQGECFCTLRSLSCFVAHADLTASCSRTSRPTPHTSSQEAEAAWKAFQSSAGSEKDAQPQATGSGTITIKEVYRFAGEDVTRERTLPADHPDAVAWLKKQRGKGAGESVPAPTTSSPTPPQGETAPPSASASASTTAVSSEAASQPVPTGSAPKPPAPGPRRKKQSKLAALAAGTEAPKKMNTLEKSKMDWDGWKGGGGGAGDGGKTLSEREREEMEAQTRTGAGSGSMAGYLGRRDFLERVRDRTEQR